MNNTSRRRWMIALTVMILFCCLASAYFSLLADHTARAISTTGAGLVFAFLMGSPTAEAEQGRTMTYTNYDTIGTGYDTTRKADPYLTERLAALLALAPGAQVLDVGCGTGNYTTALEQCGSRMTGLDPSERMLEEARGKSSTITWVNGRAEDLPFPNAVFDGAIATLTTHHWDDLTMGFRQMHRVLRMGAPLVILTSTPEQMRGYWLCHYFPGIMERSCAVMPTAEATLAALGTAGLHDIELEPYDVRSDLQDLFLYAAKDDPTRYLDPDFRRGISTFAALADDAALRSGLQQLRADVASGEWSRVRERYAHAVGDYLFVAARS